MGFSISNQLTPMKTQIMTARVEGTGRAARIVPFPKSCEVVGISIEKKTRKARIEFIPKTKKESK